MGKSFNESYIPTFGADISIKKHTIIDNGQEHLMKLTIWDLAGQPTFSNVRFHYYQGTHGILVVYDITNEKSFHNIINWMDEVGKHLKFGRIPIILLGNKTDLRTSGKGVVTTEEGRKLAEKLSDYTNSSWIVPFFETSALEGDMIEKAFDQLSFLLLRLQSDVGGNLPK